MKASYLYPHTDILKNLADIRDREMLSCMEAEYTSIRLAELVTGESVSRFDFATLCDVHHYIFIDSDLFKDHAQYMRTALAAANALFSDIGDKRKPEYLEKIVLDALGRGQKMKQRVSDVIKKAGFKATEGRIRKIVYWNRLERYEHGEWDVKLYLLQNEGSE